MNKTTEKNLNIWQQSPLDPKTQAELKRLLREDPQEIHNAFYTKLSFGTGGLRGLMGIGTNRMNIYTVGMATQGLADYLLSIQKQPRVFIGYDCRHNSREFAEEAAKVLAGNGIQVFLTKELRPTPYVSFGCRFLQCSAAIMITASHNPPEYNGYKVYWKGGGQVVFPHDLGIIEKVNAITKLDQVKKSQQLSDPLIEEVLEEIDQAYLNAIEKLQFYPEINRKEGQQLHVVYSNLHGTGITLIPQAMQKWGFTHFSSVEEQNAPDGSFPTVASPNPEEKEALQMGIKQLENEKADLLIATDPDADRVGVAVRHQGKTHLLNGNQIACLLLYHICGALPKLPENAAFVKTIATTELFREIAESFGGNCVDVLTGFKFIAEKIEQWENDPKGLQFIFGGEESYGYLLGTHAHDKDAVVSSALIAEAALHAKLEGKTLIDLLHRIWEQYGVYVEKLFSLIFPETEEGRRKMQKGMEKLEKHPPNTINNIRIMKIENYRTSTTANLQSSTQEPLTLPKSSVLRLWLEDGSILMVRPSGTEPKVKFYCSVNKKSFNKISETLSELEQHADNLLQALKNHF